MIIQETYEYLKSNYPDTITNTIIEKAVLGLHFSAVKLSGGFAGMAKTEISHHCCNSFKHNRNFGDFSPGKITGQTVVKLFEHAEDTDIINTLRLAVLNALSSGIISNSNYHIVEDKDPIELVDLNQSKVICLVGAFQTYIKKIAATSNKLMVLELDPNALSYDLRQYYIDAARYRETFSLSDIIFITGATLANQTLDDLLSAIPTRAKTIVVGPSSSMIPDLLFRKNVDIIGSTKITDTEKMFELISEGGAGYHLFNSCAKKTCIINDQKKTPQQ